MASPNWDSLSVQHSKNIGDGVVSASTNGKSWTSAQRDWHLNSACRLWISLRVGKGLANERQGLSGEFHWTALDGYINEASAALASNVKALSGWTPAVWFVLSAYNTTGSVPILPFPQRQRFFTSTGGNQFLTASATNQYYVLDGSQIRVLGSGATDTVNLRYVATHTDLAAGGSTDILIQSPFWPEILKLALAIAKMDVGRQEDQQIAQAAEGFVGSVISSN